MRDNKLCIKCKGAEIAKVPGGSAWNGRPNKLKINEFKYLPVERCVCLKCGYTEEYISQKSDLDLIRKKFYRSEKDNDFV